MTTRITSENITDATIGTADLASSVPLNTQWQPVKTATFTAVAGEGYFVNSGSALTMNLPAGVAGATIVVADYARNFSTYNLTISPNGSEKIGGVAENATLNVDGQAATFVYVDATKGWINVQNAEDTEVGVPPFISATGGTITESGDFRIHTFTGDGCFVVTSLATESPAPIYNTVSYLVVAGGGGAGTGSTPAHAAGGGGAGGFREGKNAPVDSYTASPLNAPAGIPVSLTTYPITVGAGGPAGPGCATEQGVNGNNSVFSTITSAGGGGSSGSSHTPPGFKMNGRAGGSGGGGSSQGPTTGGAGNTPPVSPPQGNNGGTGTDSPPNTKAGGGGGATAVGTGGVDNTSSGNGGAGATTCITGSPTAFAGGGGGGGSGPSGQQSKGLGGVGGGGDGGCTGAPGVAGTANTGGGSGGGKGGPPVGTSGNNGGSGIVIIRYKFQ